MSDSIFSADELRQLERDEQPRPRPRRLLDRNRQDDARCTCCGGINTEHLCTRRVLGQKVKKWRCEDCFGIYHIWIM